VLSLTEIVLNILGRVRQSCSGDSSSSSTGSAGPSPTALQLLSLCPYLAQHLLALTAQINTTSKDPPLHGQASSRLIYIDLVKVREGTDE
jgi:hypothetical protein